MSTSVISNIRESLPLYNHPNLPRLTLTAVLAGVAFIIFAGLERNCAKIEGTEHACPKATAEAYFASEVITAIVTLIALACIITYALMERCSHMNHTPRNYTQVPTEIELLPVTTA